MFSQFTTIGYYNTKKYKNLYYFNTLIINIILIYFYIATTIKKKIERSNLESDSEQIFNNENLNSSKRSLVCKFSTLQKKFILDQA